MPRANEDGVLRILLMGSSLVRGVKPHLEKIFDDEGIEATIRAVAPSLRTLAWHAQSKRSANFISGKRGEPWDYVILQENGGFVPTEGSSYNAIRQLDGMIRAAGAKTMMFMVWRDRPISPMTPGGSLMWEQLRQVGDDVGNVPIAFELDIGVVPVGWSIREARVDGGATYDQILYKGGLGHHLSKLGMYLGALSVYSALVGDTPKGLWSPKNFALTEVNFVQKVAEEIVIQDAAEWNLNVVNPASY